MAGLMSRLLAVAGMVALTLPPPAHALELSGILIHAADRAGNVAGPIWHTSMDRSGRLLGMTRYPPPVLRSIPLGNDPATAEAVKPLYAGSHITTLFWQYLPGELREAMVLNLYFNGDTANPGISVLVPSTYGLSRFVPNPASTTLALNGRATEQTARTEFTDAVHHVRLGAAFYVPSSGETSQWRPADFVDLDRVGTDRLEPDGTPDGILVFELVVEPAPRPGMTPRPQAQAGGPAEVAAPPAAIIGPDQWTPAVRSTLVTTPPPTTRATEPTPPPVATPQSPTPAASRSPGQESTPSGSPQTRTAQVTSTIGPGTPATTHTASAQRTQTPARTATVTTLTLKEEYDSPQRRRDAECVLGTAPSEATAPSSSGVNLYVGRAEATVSTSARRLCVSAVRSFRPLGLTVAANQSMPPPP